MGHHLEAVLKAVPGAQGVLFERSAAVALAEERSWADSVAERVGGRERTRDEFTGLLADAGWSVSGIREAPVPVAHSSTATWLPEVIQQTQR